MILLLSLILCVRIVGDIELGWQIGMGPLLLCGLYIISISILRNFESATPWQPTEIPEDLPVIFGSQRAKDLEVLPVHKLFQFTFISILVILIAGVGMIFVSEKLAEQTGLGASFIGVTLLAGATSLPELSTTISAVRIGAHTMAISNIFGSNLIMAALLFPADIFYRQGVLLQQENKSADFALIIGVIVTSIYIAGLLIRDKRRTMGLGFDSIFVILIYFSSLIILYFIR